MELPIIFSDNVNIFIFRLYSTLNVANRILILNELRSIIDECRKLKNQK